MSVIERIIAGAKAMMLARVVRMVSKGAVIVLLTQVFLEPSEYGLLFLAISVLGIAALFSNLGLAKAAGRYVAEFRERDPSQIPHVLSMTLGFNLVTIAVVSVVLVAFGDRIARLLGEPALSPFLLLGVGYVVALTLKTFVTLLFQGFNRVEWSALVGVIANVSLLVFVFVFVALGYGPLGALGGYVAGYAVAAVVGMIVLYRQFYSAFERAPAPEPGLAKRIGTYSIPLTATRGANILDKKIDTVLVGFFLTPTAVGFYTLGKQVADFAIAPAASLGFSLAPAFGEQKAQDNQEQAGKLYATTLEYVLALYLPATIGLFLVAEPLVHHVFGEGYRGAIPVIQVFSVYVTLRAIDKITNDSLDYLGRARIRAYAKGATAVANFLLNLVMIPIFGVVGAAVATVVTYSALVGIELVIAFAELDVPVGRLIQSLLPTAGVAVGIGVIVVLILPYVSGVASLVGVILIGVLSWAVLAGASGVVDVKRVHEVMT